MFPNPVDYKEINWKKVEEILKEEKIGFELQDNPIGWTSGQGFVDNRLFAFSNYLGHCAILSIVGEKLFKPLILAVSKVIMNNDLPRLVCEEGPDDNVCTVYWCNEEQLALLYGVLQTQQKYKIRSPEGGEFTT